MLGMGLCLYRVSGCALAAPGLWFGPPRASGAVAYGHSLWVGSCAVLQKSMVLEPNIDLLAKVYLLLLSGHMRTACRTYVPRFVGTWFVCSMPQQHICFPVKRSAYILNSRGVLMGACPMPATISTLC